MKTSAASAVSAGVMQTFPSALINQINERALDLTGETALEEFEGRIVVEGKILEKVIAAWDKGSN
jgi:hypothetical protein